MFRTHRTRTSKLMDAGRCGRRNRAEPRLEGLEGRSLLSVAGLDRSALITRGGSVDQSGGSDGILLRLGEDRLTPGSSGRTLVDIEIEPTEGSRFQPGRFRLIDERGRALPLVFEHAGASVIGRAVVRPGDFTLRVQGRGGSTGKYVAQVHLVGDVDGDRRVTESDLLRLRAAGGGRVTQAELSALAGQPTVPSDRLDVNRDGRVGALDLRRARQNLAAASQTVQLLVQNQTGRYLANDIYLAVWARDATFANPTNNPDGWSYIDATGTAHSLYGTNGPMSKITPFTLDEVPNGIEVPNGTSLISGQIYISLGSPLVLNVNSAGGSVSGVAAPAPSNPADPNNSLYWDFAEFTLNAANPATNTPLSLNADVSQVDQVGFPLTIQTSPLPNAPDPEVAGVYAARSELVAAFTKFVGADSPFLASLSTTGRDPATVYRILAPNDVVYLPVSQDPVLAKLWTYYDHYVSDFFSHWQTMQQQGQPLTITVPQAGTDYTFVGNVTTLPNATTPSQPYTVIQFTGQNGGQQGQVYTVYSPATPNPQIVNPPTVTQSVFANNGVFADNGLQYPTNGTASQILGNIENQIVAAMSRGVALLPYASWSNTAGFYPAGGIANYYAAFLHQTSVTVGGQAYGFPFDDQGNNSTDMTSLNTTQLIVTIGWDTALPTTPTA